MLATPSRQGESAFGLRADAGRLHIWSRHAAAIGMDQHMAPPSQCQAFCCVTISMSSFHKHAPRAYAAWIGCCSCAVQVSVGVGKRPGGGGHHPASAHLHGRCVASVARRVLCWQYKFMCCGAGSSSVVCDVCFSPCGHATAGSIARQHPVTLCAVCWLWACNVQSC